MSVWIDPETKRSLLRLRWVKVQREVNNGMQRKLSGWNRREGGNIK